MDVNLLISVLRTLRVLTHPEAMNVHVILDTLVMLIFGDQVAKTSMNVLSMNHVMPMLNVLILKAPSFALVATDTLVMVLSASM